MSAFQGLLHGPGLPDAGAPMQARFAGRALSVDGRAPVDAGAISVTPGGFNHDDVVLGWNDPGGAWAFVVSAPQAKQALLAHAPAELQQALRAWNRSQSFTRGFWRTVVTVVAVAGTTLLLALWQHQRVVAWTAEHISPESERSMGLSVMNGLRREGKLVEEGEAVELVRRIGGSLTAGSTRKYEWYVKDDPSVNAFAVPGGFVVVHAGLLNDTRNAEELAGVLAHEVQHVEQRHSLQNLLYQLGWAALLTVVLGDPSTITTILLLEVGNLKFSRDLEAQADAGALEALRRARIPPSGLREFFARLDKEAGSDPPDWLSTHPATADRVAAIEADIATHPCAACQPLGYDWDAMRESLYREDLIRRPAKKK